MAAQRVVDPFVAVRNRCVSPIAARRGLPKQPARHLLARLTTHGREADGASGTGRLTLDAVSNADTFNAVTRATAVAVD